MRHLLVTVGGSELGLVSALADGRHWRPNSFSHQFQLFLQESGLRRVVFHDLRHTHATQLLRQSVHPKIVAERLGHSTVTITLDTYSHVVPGLREEAARQLDRVLRKAIRDIKTGS